MILLSLFDNKLDAHTKTEMVIIFSRWDKYAILKKRKIMKAVVDLGDNI